MTRVAPPPFAGLAFDRPRIMGIVNVTPDSFSDGGAFLHADAAVAHGLKLAEQGADILDIGGESTRPGAEPVPLDEELRRVLPVVEALAAAGHPVSIDTRHAAVMKAATEAGARIINDVTALTGDDGSLAVAAASGASVILMHMLGEPGTMQADPRYDDAPGEIRGYLAGRVQICRDAGIPAGKIAVDPGIGFGKTVEHNLQILNRLGELADLGHPVVLGASRKSFIAKLCNDIGPGERVAGSLAAALAGMARGAHILRVHDVAETRQALTVWRAIETGGD